MSAEQFANSAQTTLTAAISNNVTSLTVSSAAGFPAVPQFRIRIENELLLVTAVAGTTWTVTRGIEGTTAAARATGALVTQVLTAAAVAAFVPSGQIVPFAGLTVPYGWLECDGSAVSRSTYAALFGALSATRTGTTTNGNSTVTGLATTSDLLTGMQVVGTGIPAGATIATVGANSITLSANATASGSPSLVFTAWGNGNGSTTFNLPDFRGRALIGAGTGTSLTTRTLSQTLGGETHLLSTAEMPAHTHTQQSVTAAASYSSGASLAGPAYSVINTGSAGGGGSHNNMQPSAVIRWIIKC